MKPENIVFTRIISRTTAWLLAFMFTFMYLDVAILKAAYAAGANVYTQITGEDEDQNNIQESCPNIAEELAEERTEYSTTYRNSDGTFTREIYTVPIRYKDGNGNLLDIDNSIVPTSKSRSIGDYEYTNAASPVNILISDRIENEKAIRIEKDNYEFSFSLNVPDEYKEFTDWSEKASRSIDEVLFDDDDDDDSETSEEFQTVEPSFDFDIAPDFTRETILEENPDDRSEDRSILYKNVLAEGIDVRITPLDNGVKEDIIFYEKPEITTYTYHVDLKGMYPELNENGSITFYDNSTHEEVGYMPAPYMMDSTKETMEHISTDAWYQLVKDEEANKYTINVSMGLSFFDRDDITYPVILDPSYTYQGSYLSYPSPQKGTFVTSKYPSKNWYGDTHIKVGSLTGDLGNSWGILWIHDEVWKEYLKEFDLIGAQYSLYEDYGSASKPNIHLTPVATGDWTFAGVTWNNSPARRDKNDFKQITAVSSNWNTFDITNYMKQYISGAHVNNGFYLKMENDTVNYYKRFRSEFYSDTAYRPKIIVDYNISAPKSFTVSPNIWTSGKIKVNVPDLGWPTLFYQYSIDDGKSYSDLPSDKQIAPPDGRDKSVWVRVRNSRTNPAPDVSVAVKSTYAYNRDITPPTAPTSLTASYAATGNEVTVNWSGIVEDLSGIAKVQYKINNGTYQDIPSSADKKSGSINITPLSGNDTITVRAIDRANNTGAEKSVSCALQAPTGLSATTNLSLEILLKWNTSATPGAKYDIYRSDSTDGKYIKIASDLTMTSYLDTGFIESRTYYYKVVSTRMINGQLLQSTPTPVSNATISTFEELAKQIGQKDYEDFPSFSTNGGNGSIRPNSGNLLYSKTDIDSQTPVCQINLTRTYNSLATYSTPFGKGWDHNYNIVLMPQRDIDQQETGVILKFGDGTLYRFDKQANGSYKRPKGFYGDLYWDNEAKTYKLVYTDDVVYQFNANNKIQEIRDHNGNWTRFAYNDQQLLTSATDIVGNTLTVNYSSKAGETGLISSVVWLDRATHFTYNSQQQLESAYIANGSYNHGETYFYADGILAGIKNAAGYDYAISYDASTPKRVIGVKDPLDQLMSINYGISDSEMLVTSTFQNVDTKYFYNNECLLTKMQVHTAPATQYTYDDNYNIISEKQPDSAVTSYVYNADGFCTKITDAIGNVTDYEYAGNLLMRTKEPFNGSDKKVTEYTYTENGNLASAQTKGMNQNTAYTYNSYGQPLSETVTYTSNGNIDIVTKYEYDSKGKLIKTVNPDNTVTVQEYDKYGNIVKTTDAKGIQAYMVYDVLNRVTSTTEAYGTGDAVTTTSAYDKLGNVFASTDANGNTATYEYDKLGRCVKVTNPDGTSSTTKYIVQSDGRQVQKDKDAEGSISLSVQNQKGQTIVSGVVGKATELAEGRSTAGNRWNASSQNIVSKGEEYTFENETLIEYVLNEYDLAGRIISSKDQNGVVTNTEYDRLGRAVSTVTHKGDTSEKVTTTYDDAGNSLAVTTPQGTTTNTYDYMGRVLTSVLSKDGSSSKTTFSYDGVHDGRLQTVMTDPMGRETCYDYDKMGQLTQERYKGRVTAYTYDKNGNMVSAILMRSGNLRFAMTAYEYDLLNRKTKMVYGDDHFVEYTYDNNGNVLTERLTQNGTVTTNEYAYDDKNQRTTYKRDGVLKAKYDYSEGGALASIQYGGDGARKIGYEYDEAGKLIFIKDMSVSGEPKLREYRYLNGQLDSILDAQGTTQAFGYDGLGRVTAVEYKDKAQSLMEGYTVEYNDKGQIVREAQTQDYGTPSILEKTYEYDALGHLVKDTIGGVETTYTYDAVGNRLSMTSGGRTLEYTYNEYDQLTAISDGTAYAYDLAGNQISESNGSGTTIYAYDAANHLASVSKDGKLGASYAYDANGQRIQKTVGSSVTNYAYSGIHLLYTQDGKGTLLEENVLETDGSIVCSKRQDGQNYWYRQDIRGSITNIVDGLDEVVKSYTYAAYGYTETKGDFLNSFAFTGAVIDEETGLYYMNARYYDTQTGRFISEDSYRGTGETFWHLYAYCDGDPVNCTDLTGHAAKDLFNSADAAAADFVRIANPMTYKQNREMGTTIYKLNFRKGITKYIYLKINPGGHNDIVGTAIFAIFGRGLIIPTPDMRWNKEFPITATVAALAHTHPSCKCHNGVDFSWQDKAAATLYSGTIYLGTTNGLLKKWVIWKGESTVRKDMPKAKKIFPNNKIVR